MTVSILAKLYTVKSILDPSLTEQQLLLLALHAKGIFIHVTVTACVKDN